MKKVIQILKLFAIILLVLSCSKNDDKIIDKPQEKAIFYESTVTKTGRDEALCACCGDWKIVVDNMVYPININLPFIYQFKFLPANSNINLETATFPLNVKINWSIDNNTCN